mgnify:CR=1 FL=1
MPTFALNFSRPGAQVLLQYYMFLRLGFDGYRRVQQTSHDVAKYLSGEIEQMDDFTLWNDGSDIPVFAWMLNDKPDRKWNLYDLQDRLRMKGWLVPAYPMPVDLTQVTVQRIVVRNGFSHDMAEAFIKDIWTDCAHQCQARLVHPDSTTDISRSFHEFHRFPH